MLKNIKISSAVTSVIVIFALALITAMLANVINARSHHTQFKSFLTSVSSDNKMRDNLADLNGALAHINELLLQKSLNRSVDSKYIELAHTQLANAKKTMSAYVAAGIYEPGLRSTVEKLNKDFNQEYNVAMEKLAHINNPASLSDTLALEVEKRAALHNDILRYTEISDRQSQGYAETREENYQFMIAATVLGLISCIAMLLMVRIWLKKILVKPMAETTRSLQMIADGDLSQPIIISSTNELGLMLLEVEKMRVSLTRTVSGIREGVTHIHHHAREVAKGNNELSYRTEEQASALQQTAASMEEIKTTVRQNADNVHSACELAESASVNARNGGDVMVQLESIMQQISKSSRQIAEINNVIDSIAKQTNILSLNAAVEAARAGEQGRGFAVVAEEVRNLARRSADAAKEINDLIITCVSNMDTGAQQVNHASTVMKDIVSSIGQVTGIMSEITSASDEQSAGINQIAQAVNEMDLVTQQNATMVEEGAVAASNLESQSESLNCIVSQFTTEACAGKMTTVTESIASPIRARPSDDSRHAEPVMKKVQEDQWETF